jgi:hypothetical protein
MQKLGESSCRVTISQVVGRISAKRPHAARPLSKLLSDGLSAAGPKPEWPPAIREDASAPRNNAHSPQFPTTSTMHRALHYESQRKHQYETLEHLLLALTDDVDASVVMKACKVDLSALKEKLINYIDNDLKTNVINDSAEPKQSAGFQRVVQRPAHYAEGRGRPNWTSQRAT